MTAVAGIFSVLLVLGGPVGARSGQASTSQAKSARPAANPSRVARGKQWKIENAMSAAPRSVSREAAVLELPGDAGGEPVELRKGTNEWTCIPDDPTSPANDPVCVDRMGLEWTKAWREHREPKLAGSGLGYALRGGASASDTDPFAKEPADTRSWIGLPPHIRIFPLGRLDAAVYGSDARSGKPWILWGGTPYEHLIVPVK